MIEINCQEALEIIKLAEIAYSEGLLSDQAILLVKKLAKNEVKVSSHLEHLL